MHGHRWCVINGYDGHFTHGIRVLLTGGMVHWASLDVCGLPIWIALFA